MSVNWSWNNKMGEITVKQNGSKPCTYKVNIYHANCLCALIYEVPKSDQYMFWGFFNDRLHLQRCIGLKPYMGRNYETHTREKMQDNTYAKGNQHEWKKLRLNTYYKEMKIMAEDCVKAGFKVELYYKEPKQPKKKKVTVKPEN